MSEIFSYLASEERESLGTLPFPVFLPAQLMEGWTAQPGRISTEEDEASYEISFTKNAESVFRVLATDSGVGDALPGTSQSEIHHPELELVLVEHEEDGSFQSDWLTLDGGCLAVSGKGLTDSELESWIIELTPC